MAVFGRTKFRLRQHDLFVRDHESELIHYPASPCPCGTLEDPSQALPNCPVCGGSGYAYGVGGPVWGLLVGIGTEKRLLDLGLLAPGDSIFSPNPYETRDISDHDLLRSTWVADVPFEGEVLTRGTGTTDALVYPPRAAIACWSIVTGIRTNYIEGTDFSLDHNNRRVTWIPTGAAPALAAQYSVKYYHDWEWIAFTAPQPRWEVWSRLGIKVVLKRKHTVGRNDPAPI